MSRVSGNKISVPLLGPFRRILVGQLYSKRASTHSKTCSFTSFPDFFLDITLIPHDFRAVETDINYGTNSNSLKFTYCIIPLNAANSVMVLAEDNPRANLWKASSMNTREN